MEQCFNDSGDQRSWKSGRHSTHSMDVLEFFFKEGDSFEIKCYDGYTSPWIQESLVFIWFIRNKDILQNMIYIYFKVTWRVYEYSSPRLCVNKHIYLSNFSHASSLLCVVVLTPTCVPSWYVYAKTNVSTWQRIPLSIIWGFLSTPMPLELNENLWCYNRILQVLWWLLTAWVPAGKIFSLEIHQLLRHTRKMKKKPT